MLHANTIQQRPVTSVILQFNTIPNHRQCRITSAQLRQIPLLPSLRGARNTSCALKTICSAPGVTTKIPNVIAELRKSHSTSGMRHSPSLDRNGRAPFSISRVQLIPTEVITVVESLPQVCHNVQQIVAEEVDFKFVKQLQQATQQSQELLFRNLFYWLYQSRKKTEKRSLPIYWNRSCQHGWKRNFGWGISSNF